MRQRSPATSRDPVSSGISAPSEATRSPAVLPVAAGTIDPHYPWYIVYEGYTVVTSARDGSIDGGPTGLFDYDTRVLSRHRLLLDGVPPEYVSSGLLESNRWEAELRVPRPGGHARGPALPQDAVEISLQRRVGCGMEERIRVRNHSMTPVAAELTLELDADFADANDLRAVPEQCGTLQREWSEGEQTLRFDYAAERDGHRLERALRIRIIRSDSAPVGSQDSLRFSLALPPRGEWTALLGYESLVDGQWRLPLSEGPAGRTERDRERARWRGRRAFVETGEQLIGPAFERAAEDLFALRAWEYDHAPDAWFPVAGVPTYTGIFGRDCLTAGWQAAVLGPEMMRGSLAVIARTQAREDSPWRDEEPGKMVHEIRRGPLSELEIIPQRGYYGTQTSPAMFVLALSEAWHWTGDDGLLRQYRDAALATFAWASRYGDRDGDGFLEYQKRSRRGLKNQAWKDSDEAIRYPDGTLVENPIATIEEQAYHFVALERMAEMLIALDEEERAADFLEEARRLKGRFHEAFWSDADGFYALALDPDKRPVRSIASNPGHALAVGVVPPECARRVAERLLAPDLFSGWGVRTLSTEHPSYNPWGYHLGTVWPVENATFALGMKRYGLDEHAERIARAMLEATAYFQDGRLPEVLCGHARHTSPLPCAYPGSCSPQAWSASATIQLVQILLGLYPFAPARLLALVRARLPEGVDALTVRRLRVGDAVVSLRFERREDGAADHTVIEKDGDLHVLSVPPPQDLERGEESWAERLKAWLLEHAPGRTAAALRVALGDLEL